MSNGTFYRVSFAALWGAVIFAGWIAAACVLGIVMALAFVRIMRRRRRDSVWTAQDREVLSGRKKLQQTDSRKEDDEAT